MKQIRGSLLAAILIFAATALWAQQPPAPQLIDLKSPDGAILKASYFAAGKPGPASCCSIRATGHASRGMV
jgi:hypothetical protein